MALSGVEAIHISTVLEDCVDQLAILGRIMPVSFEERNDASEIVSGEIIALVEQQRKLESKFEGVAGVKNAILDKSKSSGDKNEETVKDLHQISRDLKSNTHVFARSLKQSPLTPDNLEKVQIDRGFLEKVLLGTLIELTQNGNFNTLIKSVINEKEKKAKLQHTIQQEEEGRKRVRMLQRRLYEVKKEKETEVQQRNEMIAHLKDQLQEMKAKTNMEGKYIKKCAEVSVAQTQKRCNIGEKECRDEIESLKEKIDEENRVNAEIESFLRAHTEGLQKMVEYWMEKYEKDVELKQKELDILKASKAKDLERLQELTKLYTEYEQVVVEDRIEKEKARRKAEQEAEELRASIRVQSWWRGVMVRKGLGPYSKKKRRKERKERNQERVKEKK